MGSFCKMTPWLVAIFCLVTAGCTNPMDQQTSETTHDQQVAILKQIRKVNEDGSYTFGYEAGDGSFKVLPLVDLPQVESRDVLGNIKGTFGFVDAEGEIKRVSYSSSNGTGFKATTATPLQEQVSVVQSIPRLNLTSTTRKPSIVYATEASARSSVVQAIPRLRKTTTTSTTTTSTTTTTEPPTVKPNTYYGHYIKSTPPRSRPRFGVQTVHQRPPMVVEEDPEEDEDSQINRPVTEEKDVSPYRRIVYAKRPVDPSHALRPITEEFEDNEDEIKITTGNTLRRQLNEDTTKSEGASEAVDEHADVYGGALSVSRPLFTTITPPRVLQRGAGLRVERPKTIYVNQDNVGPARFDQTPKYEANRVYETDAKASQEERNAQQQQILFRNAQRSQVTAQASRDYARQSSEPIYVREHPDQQQFLREVPPEGIIVEARRANEDEDDAVGGYRQVPLGRIIFRPLPNQQPLYPTTPEPKHMRYLADQTDPEHLQTVPRNHVHQNYIRPVPRPIPRPLSYPEEDPQSGQVLDRVPEEGDYPTTQDYPYRSSNIALPPESTNPITPPLSRRDFQILLRRLLISQYGARALAYPRTYLEDALYDQQSYPTYHTDYQTPAPRQNVHRNTYDPAPLPVQYGERVAVQSTPLRRPSFSRAMNPLNPIYQPNRYEDYQDTGYAKRVYRQKFYAQETNESDNEEVLPPPVREALLLRMLQLAINPDRNVIQPAMISPATINPNVYRYRKMGPVRNVQIITDDSEEEKDLVVKKM